MTDNKNLQHWACLTAFSVVSLTSLTSSFDDSSKDWVREQKWAVSATAISLCIGAFSFLLSMFKREVFAGTHVEHFAVILSLGMWCAGLPNILNPDSSLAVDGFGIVTNVNLFFASWAAFITSMYLFVGMVPKLMGERGDSPFMPHWMGIGTASLIVMTNAVRFWRDMCDIDNDSSYCKRDLFAFILGAVGGLFAILFMGFHHEMLEQGMSVLFLVAWCFGIAYLTFEDGPAMFTGTFYFAIWASFLFALNMAVMSMMSLYDSKFSGSSAADAGGDNAAPGDGTKDDAGQEETAKQEVEEEHEAEPVAETA